MLLPSTHEAALLVLILSFLCLASWANLFKVSRWRYELFYFDFTAGALLLALAAAFTLGTLGSELSYADRIAVAGLKSQALAISSGFAFSLGSMLLLAAIALLGMAISFPLTYSLAFLVTTAASWRGTKWASIAESSALFLGAAVSTSLAARAWATAKTSTNKQAARLNASRAIKGISVAVFGGVLIGISYPLGSAAFWGDLGLGAYAGLLMFVVGMVIATLIFNVFLMNIGLDGGRVTLPTYLKGTPGQHLLGLLGGVVWALGMLAGLLGLSTPTISTFAFVCLSQGWVLLATVWGLLFWREFKSVPNSAKITLLIGCLAFAAAVLVSALAV